MVEQINCDIFKAPIDVLIHQANCFHTMGGGIASAIKLRFPEVYEADLTTGYGDRNKLGGYSLANTSKSGSIKYVYNLYSQFNYGAEKRQTDYEAFYRGMEKIRVISVPEDGKFLSIGIPYMIGCGLAGGNWKIIEIMIQEIWKDYPSKVYICRKV